MNYVANLENTIIIIKGVPAKVCIECGEQYFDDKTAENIERMTKQLKEMETEITILITKKKLYRIFY